MKTIKKSVSLSGIGLHSGKSSTLVFKPAFENTGIVFVKGGQRIKASLENVISTIRGTNLKDIQVVEHVLAAVYGLGIDNLEIEIDGDEPPVIDGSALPYVELLKLAGICEEGTEKNFIEIKEPIRIKEGDKEISALPSKTFEVSYTLKYPDTFIGTQKAEFVEGRDDFAKEIAPARTFGFLKEAEELWAKGLALGGTFDNAVVITDIGYSSPLRFENELARHKILDLMGDLALIGRRIKGKIIAIKSGHELNIKLAREIARCSSS